MNTDGGGEGGSGGPPEGLLAGQALAAESTPAAPAAPAAATLTMPELPPDPNYREPMTLEEYIRIATVFARALNDPAMDKTKLALDQQNLVEFLIVRVKHLLAALMPFATQALVFSNARMCLRAEGRGDEPTGGIWVNQVVSTHLSPSESLFFDACDAVGRKRTQEHMEAAFARLQEGKKLAAEREAHVEAGGKLH